MLKYKLMFTFLFLALGSTAAHASSTWYVDGIHGNDSNDCKSFQHACKTIGHGIMLASSGDSILLARATYAESLTISFNLNVIGYGASGVAVPAVVIDGQGRNRVVTISDTAQVTLSNLTIQNGFLNGNGAVASTTLER
jgi:hypothetical protein